MKNMQVIEYWRKKYLTEAMIVMFLAGLAMGLFVIYIGCGEFKLLFFSLAVFCAYLMIKELRADLQTRAENLIFLEKNADFEKLNFDFGRGIDEKKLLELTSIGAYQVRECGNVIKKKGFIIEEDWLYSVISAKFLSFNQTAFHGIILRIDVPALDKKMTSVIEQINGQISIKGELLNKFNKEEFKKIFEALLMRLTANKIVVETVRREMYFLIKTDKPLFYQFSLLKPCVLSPFIERLKFFDKAAEKLEALLNG